MPPVKVCVTRSDQSSALPRNLLLAKISLLLHLKIVSKFTDLKIFTAAKMSVRYTGAPVKSLESVPSSIRCLSKVVNFTFRSVGKLASARDWLVPSLHWTICLHAGQRLCGMSQVAWAHISTESVEFIRWWCQGSGWKPTFPSHQPPVASFPFWFPGVARYTHTHLHCWNNSLPLPSQILQPALLIIPVMNQRHRSFCFKSPWFRQFRYQRPAPWCVIRRF